MKELLDTLSTNRDLCPSYLCSNTQGHWNKFGFKLSWHHNKP